MRILVRRVRGRKRAPNWAEMAKEVERTMDKVIKPELIREFQKVTRNWQNKPIFRGRKIVTRNDIRVYVFPAGRHKMIWRYVSEGTRPHIIRPKHAKALRFSWGGPGSYIPKTTTKPSWGGPGVVRGGRIVYRQEVHHPGTKARNFEKFIADRYKERFRRHVENALRRGARRA